MSGQVLRPPLLAFSLVGYSLEERGEWVSAGYEISSITNDEGKNLMRTKSN